MWPGKWFIDRRCKFEHCLSLYLKQSATGSVAVSGTAPLRFCKMSLCASQIVQHSAMQASVTCAATGPLSVPELSRIRGADGHEVFSERKGLSLFKNKVGLLSFAPASCFAVLEHSWFLQGRPCKSVSNQRMTWISSAACQDVLVGYLGVYLHDQLCPSTALHVTGLP